MTTKRELELSAKGSTAAHCGLALIEEPRSIPSAIMEAGPGAAPGNLTVRHACGEEVSTTAISRCVGRSPAFVLPRGLQPRRLVSRVTAE